MILIVIMTMIRLTFITLTNDVINGQFDHHLVSKRIMGLAMILLTMMMKNLRSKRIALLMGKTRADGEEMWSSKASFTLPPWVMIIDD